MRTERNPHKEMTPPSTKNLKALGLWVFFLICCSKISFLTNMGLRLTHEYLTISLRVPHLYWYTPPRAEANDPLLVLSFTHLNRTRLLETHRQEDFWYRDQSVLTWAGYTNLALIPLVGKIKEETLGRSQEWELILTHIRGWHHI